MCRRSIRAAVGPAAGRGARAPPVHAPMTYQVLARKYRPQTFEDVVGQRGVTQTLRNALARDRLAQAFVFAGPRGVGKTTTARILARALNCAEGPTAQPCGTCDACREIAEGRDIDVLEIDAATHTQVENVREVIIAGLAVAPVRNRYKVYIIDEVHQLSGHSFNALLKSIEEPPPHAVFMMATTELGRIPDTILSRSQVYEFRTIGRQVIADQLAKIAATESIAIDADALGVIARAADGSMRDAQSAFDQVIAFAGEAITADDVSAVLGLIGREPVLDVIEAVADEDPGPVFDLAGRFVESGYDLRAVCRELARAVRDLMAVSIDPQRAQDPEIAADGERERLAALAGRFSREDLLRGFDVVVRAEVDMRGAAQPRFHLEMALLRWMHLRKLVPLSELLTGASRPAPASAANRSSTATGTAERRRGTSSVARGRGRTATAAPGRERAPATASPPPNRMPPTTHAAPAAQPPPQAQATSPAQAPTVAATPTESARPPRAPGAGDGTGSLVAEASDAPAAPATARPAATATAAFRAQPTATAGAVASDAPPAPPAATPSPGGTPPADVQPTSAAHASSASADPAREPDAPARDAPTTDAKAAVLDAIKRAKSFFHGTVVAQAQRIALRDDRLEFTFTATQRSLLRQAEQRRGWMESVASEVVGRPIAVSVTTGGGATDTPAPAGGASGPATASDANGGEVDPLRERVMKDSLIKAMLDVLPAEIESVEKI